MSNYVILFQLFYLLKCRMPSQIYYAQTQIQVFFKGVWPCQKYSTLRFLLVFLYFLFYYFFLFYFILFYFFFLNFMSFFSTIQANQNETKIMIKNKQILKFLCRVCVWGGWIRHICSELRVCKQGGIFNVQHMLQHGVLVFRVSSEGLPYSIGSYDT